MSNYWPVAVLSLKSHTEKNLLLFPSPKKRFHQVACLRSWISVKIFNLQLKVTYVSYFIHDSVFMTHTWSEKIKVTRVFPMTSCFCYTRRAMIGPFSFVTRDSVWI